MACCALLLRLLAWMYLKATARTSALPTTPFLPVVPLLALAAVEFALTVALVGARGADSGMTDMHIGHPYAMNSVSAVNSVALVASLIVTAAVTGSACLFARPGVVASAVAIALSLVISVVAQTVSARSSHVVSMMLLEVCLVIVPVIVVGFASPSGLADDVWVVVRAALAILFSGVMIAVLLGVHGSSSSAVLSAAGVALWWAVPAGVAAGVAFWSATLRFRLPRRLRAGLVLAVMETGSVVGLAMLVGGRPLPGVGIFGLSSVADQRLAGILMMAVDVGVLVMLVGNAALSTTVENHAGRATWSAQTRR
jgi:hypothetical protein